jgi:hypothetical protein
VYYGLGHRRRRDVSTSEERIEAALLLFLKEEHGIEAISARVGESEVERGADCSCCGIHEADLILTPIHYRLADKSWDDDLNLHGTAPEFLPKLVKYLDRITEQDDEFCPNCRGTYNTRIGNDEKNHHAPCWCGSDGHSTCQHY